MLSKGRRDNGGFCKQLYKQYVSPKKTYKEKYVDTD